MLDDIIKLLTHEDVANNELGLQLALGQNLIPELLDIFKAKLAAKEIELQNAKGFGQILDLLMLKDGATTIKFIINQLENAHTNKTLCQ